MKQTQQGFTLIELMVTVAIVGILASIAYPSYQDSVMKSRRADVKGYCWVWLMRWNGALRKPIAIVRLADWWLLLGTATIDTERLLFIPSLLRPLRFTR